MTVQTFEFHIAHPDGTQQIVRFQQNEGRRPRHWTPDEVRQLALIAASRAIGGLPDKSERFVVHIARTPTRDTIHVVIRDITATLELSEPLADRTVQELHCLYALEASYVPRSDTLH